MFDLAKVVSNLTPAKINEKVTQAKKIATNVGTYFKNEGEKQAILDKYKGKGIQFVSAQDQEKLKALGVKPKTPENKPIYSGTTFSAPTGKEFKSETAEAVPSMAPLIKAGLDVANPFLKKKIEVKDVFQSIDKGKKVLGEVSQKLADESAKEKSAVDLYKQTFLEKVNKSPENMFTPKYGGWDGIMQLDIDAKNDFRALPEAEKQKFYKEAADQELKAFEESQKQKKEQFANEYAKFQEQLADPGGVRSNVFFPDSVIRKYAATPEEERENIIKEALVDIPTGGVRGFLDGMSFGIIGQFAPKSIERQDVFFKENKDLQNFNKGFEQVVNVVGQFVGGVPTYGAVAGKVGQALNKIPKVGTFLAKHPVFTSYVVQNLGEEMVEGSVRKATGQQYGVADFGLGMLMGAGMEGVGRLVSKNPLFKAIKPKEVVAKFEDGLSRAEAQKGTTLTNNEVKEVLFNTQLTPNLYGRDLFAEARLTHKTMRDANFMGRGRMTELKSGIQGAPTVKPELVEPELPKLPELKGGKEGMEGIDFPSKLPESSSGINVDEYVKANVAAKNKALEGKSKNLGSELVKEFKRKLIDSNAPIEDAIREAQKKYGFEVLPKNDVSYQIDRVLRAPTLAGQFMEDNGLAKVIKDVPDIDKLDQYLIAKHAATVEKAGIKTGRDLVKDQALIKALAVEYEPYAKVVTGYSQKILDYAVDTGLVSKKMADELKAKYPDYVPLNRVFSEDEKALMKPRGNGGSGVATLSKQTVVQKLKGSEREIESPIESLLGKTNDLFVQGEKNKAASIIGSWSKLPGLRDEIIPLRTEEQVSKKISLFEALKESKPLKSKLTQLVKTQGAWVKQLESEINTLNKEGLEAYLKRKPQPELIQPKSQLEIKRTMKEGTVVTDTGDKFKRPYLDKVELGIKGIELTKKQVKQIVNNFVNLEPEKIAAIKKKIGVRNDKLNLAIERLENLKDRLDELNDLRKTQFDETRALKDAETKGKSTISFLKNGIKEVYEVPKEIAEAAKGLDIETLNLVEKIVLRAPVRLFKLGTTALRPAFIGANLIKDQLTAFINSKNSLRTSILNPTNFTQSLFAAVKHDDLYKELVRMGGGGTSFDIGREQVKESVGRIRANKNIVSKIAYTVKHPSELLRTIENVVGRSEEVTRIQQYKGTLDSLIKQGRSLEDAKILAAKAAMENTANFFRSGQWGRIINTVAYLNSGIQGSRAFVRSAKRDLVGTGIKLTTTLFLPMATITAWALSDPQRKAAYEDIPDHEKENNFIIIPPNPVKDPVTGNWNVIKMPLPSGVGSFASPIRRVMEQAHGLDPIKFTEITNSLINGVSPVQLTDENGINITKIPATLIPQFLKPAIEVSTNKDFFTEAPIIPSSLEGLPPELQARENTSGSARAIGKVLNMSPLQVEKFVSGYGGGLSRELMNTVDKGLAAGGLIPPEQASGPDPFSAVGSKFTSARGGQELSNLYEAKDKANSEAKAKNFILKQDIDKFVKNKDKEGLKNYLETLDKDKFNYAKKYLTEKSTKKDDKLAEAKSELNAHEAIKYYGEDIDSALKSKDKQKILEMVTSLDSKTAQKGLLLYIAKRKQELGY